MSKSSTCVLRPRRFGVRPASVGAVTGAARVVLAAATVPRPASSLVDAAPPILAIGVGLGAGVALPARALLRGEPGVLACRNRRLTFGLGSFLLPSLGKAAPRAAWRRRWLPAQRRGLEHDWHAQRCAVYSPPLAAATTLAANATPP